MTTHASNWTNISSLRPLALEKEKEAKRESKDFKLGLKMLDTTFPAEPVGPTKKKRRPRNTLAAAASRAAEKDAWMDRQAKEFAAEMMEISPQEEEMFRMEREARGGRLR